MTIAIRKPKWSDKYGLKPPKFHDEDEARAFAEWLSSFRFRPWDWVLACYPWGVEGSPLQHRKPELWQRQWLKQLQSALQAITPNDHGEIHRVLRMATAAGNGVGKTSITAWVTHWFLSVYPHAEAVVTASTEAQLSGKTWRELRKWQVLAINGWQMDWTATRYRHKDAPETWFAEARPWSESNPQAMAGTHEKYVLILFDEASGVSPLIWDAIEGAMTTGLVLFLAFGNPSDGEGGFYDCFHSAAGKWIKYRVDAREVTFANSEEIQSWVDLHGIDSDFVRVHVLGKFPKQSMLSFIDSGVVQEALDRNIEWRYIPRAVPKLMAVDVARQGGDMNVIIKRQGRKVHPDVKAWSERDTMVSCDYIAHEINDWRPDLVFVDGVGMGGPIIDYLRKRGFSIIDVQSGAKPQTREERDKYVNMRMVMWMRMKEMLPSMDLPKDQELAEELSWPHFEHELRTDRMLLEPKKKMIKRGLRSPNKADALAYTFWFRVPTIGGSGGYVEPEDV